MRRWVPQKRYVLRSRGCTTRTNLNDSPIANLPTCCLRLNNRVSILTPPSGMYPLFYLLQPI